MKELIFLAIEVPDGAQYPIWIIAFGLVISLVEKFTPIFSQLTGKKNCEEKIKVLEQQQKEIKESHNTFQEKYKMLEKKYNDLEKIHDIVLNRIEVLMSIDPENDFLNYVMPPPKE